ncbi:DUF3160 domain-containing protein [Sorangium sp. So ce134]
MMRYRSLVPAAALSSIVSIAACSPAPSTPAPSTPGARPPKGAADTPPSSPGPSERAPAPASVDIARRFEGYLKKYQDLTYGELEKELGVKAASDAPLSFDPTTLKHFDVVARELQMTSAEREVFKRRGFVNVDHMQRYSMGSTYFAIYARDLPVLITTDSVLHALHRSYDEMLKTLESVWFKRTLEQVLEKTHLELGKHKKDTSGGALAESLGDVDLYLTVARNLLAGAGAPRSAGGGDPSAEVWDGALRVPSRFGQDAKALEILGLIASLELQAPDGRPGTSIYGGQRHVDYSQFRPRGHYNERPELKRYFRAMMWLGRADLGFVLEPPAAVSELRAAPARERRDAALLGLALRSSGELGRLQAVSQVVDFMVGRSDDTSVGDVLAAAEAAGIKEPVDLAADGAAERLAEALARVGRKQQVRSQVLGSSVGDTVKTPPPLVFQVFGQRFALDSFVLSQVVFDSIVFRGEKQTRMMPAGLDVMAALGNDEAVSLLKPELERHNYAANLAAARKVVEELPQSEWSANLYGIWLDSLRLLDDTPGAEQHFPEVMRTRAWQHKQAQTQLASWAELRHDTLLYAKPSYTAYPTCGYPEGYVEPYPDVYARLRFFAEEGARRLAAAQTGHEDPNVAKTIEDVRREQVEFLRNFAGVMQALEGLARKELAAQPFTDEEAKFIEKTIDIRGGGSGPPRYDGWYTKLFYRDPAAWKPTVADVHTDPSSGAALEVAAGDANFLVIAIDNQKDRAVYVGPASSYYEFREPATQRLTNEEWQQRILSGKAPPRPSFVRSFLAPPASRTLERRARP